MLDRIVCNNKSGLSLPQPATLLDRCDWLMDLARQTLRRIFVCLSTLKVKHWVLYPLLTAPRVLEGEKLNSCSCLPSDGFNQKRDCNHNSQTAASGLESSKSDLQTQNQFIVTPPGVHHLFFFRKRSLMPF